MQVYSFLASRWLSWASLARLHPQSWWNGKLRPMQETTSSQPRRCLKDCGRVVYHRAPVKFSVKCMIHFSSCQVMLFHITIIRETFYRIPLQRLIVYSMSDTSEWACPFFFYENMLCGCGNKMDHETMNQTNKMFFCFFYFLLMKFVKCLPLCGKTGMCNSMVIQTFLGSGLLSPCKTSLHAETCQSNTNTWMIKQKPFLLLNSIQKE